MRRTAIALTMVAVILLMASCTTLGETTTTTNGYETIQVIDVQKKNYTSASANLPISAIIEPTDLVTSPVIDITTLKAVEQEKQASVKSSTLQQETRKNEIQESIIYDPLTDTSLDEETYGMSSGTLASQATSDAFKYITSSDAFTGAIAVYDWIEGYIYEIVTSPKAITDFRLKPGENITGAPVVNDGAAAWQFTMGTSVEDGVTVQHLFIKPSTVGLDTSMIVLTDQRTYYFRIASFEKSYMTALRFNYPVDTGKGYYVDEDFKDYIVDPYESTDSIYSLDLSKVDYNYKITQSKGKPAWTPQNVFSDERSTYIQIPATVANTNDWPSVYIIKNGETVLVNWRIIGNLYQIDEVITTKQTILLTAGDKEQVKITRTK